MISNDGTSRADLSRHDCSDAHLSVVASHILTTVAAYSRLAWKSGLATNAIFSCNRSTR